MLGVPNSLTGDPLHDWANLPISRPQFAQECREQLYSNFLNCEPIPGAYDILSTLKQATNSAGDTITLALATGTKSTRFEMKTHRPETQRLLAFIPVENRVLGDDPRLEQGRGKPAPDTFLVSLQNLNATGDGQEQLIKAQECLVFEDSIAGVEAARRAGMRVIWVPHPDMALEYQDIKKEVLAGRTGMNDIGDHEQLGEIDDGWAECIDSLNSFNFVKYGILRK